VRFDPDTVVQEMPGVARHLAEPGIKVADVQTFDAYAELTEKLAIEWLIFRRHHFTRMADCYAETSSNSARLRQPLLPFARRGDRARA
jgi:hypothetical protein